PALPGHVELERERHILTAGAGVEVVARAPRAFEGLDLAHEDAVHQLAGGVGRVGIVGPEGSTLAPGGRPAGVEDDLLDANALEALVAGEIVNCQHPLHLPKPPEGRTENVKSYRAAGPQPYLPPSASEGPPGAGRRPRPPATARRRWRAAGHRGRPRAGSSARPAPRSGPRRRRERRRTAGPARPRTPAPRPTGSGPCRCPC